MGHYIPHTEVERQQMLSAIGVTTIEDLFEAVPASHRFPKLNLPKPMSELEVAQEMQALADTNEHANDFALFRGAGAYHHFIPSVVNHTLLRGEFFFTRYAGDHECVALRSRCRSGNQNPKPNSQRPKSP